jgi:hydrogenase expression/formation protein HypC
MCLAIPGKVLFIENGADAPRMADVSFGGIIKKASLEILPEAKEGDYVLVHVGVAISKVDEAEAQKVYKFLKDFGELNELENDNPQTIIP